MTTQKINTVWCGYFLFLPFGVGEEGVVIFWSSDVRGGRGGGGWGYFYCIFVLLILLE